MKNSLIAGGAFLFALAALTATADARMGAGGPSMSSGMPRAGGDIRLSAPSMANPRGFSPDGRTFSPDGRVMRPAAFSPDGVTFSPDGVVKPKGSAKHFRKFNDEGPGGQPDPDPKPKPNGGGGGKPGGSQNGSNGAPGGYYGSRPHYGSYYGDRPHYGTYCYYQPC